MHTQCYDTGDGYNTLHYANNYYKQDKFEEIVNDLHETLFEFETVTSGENHMPYLCWTYNDELQQECVGINTCAVDVLNALPTDKHDNSYQLLIIQIMIVHLFLEYLGHVKPIVKGGRVLQIKATYYNPVKRNKFKQA